MATYDDTFRKTAAHEGGYVHDPDDVGGETYKGVSRRYNPSWGGWRLIDELKQASGDFPDNLEQNVELQASVKDFYKQNYWDKFWGDEIPAQEIAEELFDTSVNMGARRAVTFFQEGMNLLNRNQRDYKDITEDGLFGRKTLEVLTAYLKVERGDCKPLLKVMNILQGMHYIEYMRKSPTQEKYARGWFKRT